MSAVPVPSVMKITSSRSSWKCSRTWQPGATVWVPALKSTEAPVFARLSKVRTKPLAGTGCQKLSPSSGPTTTAMPGSCCCFILRSFY